MKQKWIIINIYEPELAWSNEDGWVHKGYDLFTTRQKLKTRLPLEGAWQEVVR